MKIRDMLRKGLRFSLAMASAFAIVTAVPAIEGGNTNNTPFITAYAASAGWVKQSGNKWKYRKSNGKYAKSQLPTT